MATVKLGSKVRDKITGFTGVVTGIVNYLTDCQQALIAPPLDKDGKMQDSVWLDVQRLDDTGEPPITIDNGNTPGFDRAPPKR